MLMQDRVEKSPCLLNNGRNARASGDCAGGGGLTAQGSKGVREECKSQQQGRDSLEVSVTGTDSNPHQDGKPMR